MNIILVVIDSLRQNHLSMNGYERNTSPNIDTFSENSTCFSSVYTTLPRTSPSLVSIFTGLFPHNHGVRMVHGNKSKMSASTLADILRSHCYKTAFMGLHGHYNELVEKGFQECNLTSWKLKNKISRIVYKTFHPTNFLGITEQNTDIAIDWIKKNSDEKFFLCIHFIDLHWPYEVPKPFENMFDSEYTGNHDFITLCDGKYSRGDIIFGNVKLPDEEIKHAIAHYDGGLRYIDNQVGKILDTLKTQRLDDNTLVIITADHGENFGEHNFYFHHGASLYETSLKIPLFIRHPQIPKGKIIKHKVQNIDILPTVLEILKIPLLDEIDGKSFLPLIHDKVSVDKNFIFAESIEDHFKGNKKSFINGVKGKWRAIIVGDWKLIYIPHPDKEIFELYNLKDDPDEVNNLVFKNEKIASEMKIKLLDFLKYQSDEGDANLANLTEKSKKLLRKLGYMD